MGVTNLSIVQFLLDSTQRAQPNLAWRESGVGHVTTIHGVHIELFRTEGRGISGLCLRFNRADDSTWIEEPRISSMFSRRYRDDDDRRLAEAMSQLRRAVHAQCCERRTRAEESRESIRQSLYHRVLFGDR